MIAFSFSVFWGMNGNTVTSFLITGNILQKTCFLIITSKKFVLRITFIMIFKVFKNYNYSFIKDNIDRATYTIIIPRN